MSTAIRAREGFDIAHRNPAPIPRGFLRVWTPQGVAATLLPRLAKPLLSRLPGAYQALIGPQLTVSSLRRRRAPTARAARCRHGCGSLC